MAKMKDKNDTPARRRCIALVERAMVEHWSASKLAKKAGVCRGVATEVLQSHTRQLHAKMSDKSTKIASRLVEVARKAQDAELRTIQRHIALVERAIRQLELADDLDISDLAKLTALRSQHHKLVESLTGIDVVKQIAVRAATPKDGEMIAWDGVEALDAATLDLLPGHALPALPAPVETCDDLF